MKKYNNFQEAKVAADKMFKTSSENIEIIEVRAFLDYNYPYFIVKKEAEKSPALTDDCVIDRVKYYRH